MVQDLTSQRSNLTESGKAAVPVKAGIDRRSFLTTIGSATQGAAFAALCNAASGRLRIRAARGLIARYITEKKIGNGVIAVGEAGGEPDYISQGTYEIGGVGPKVSPDTLFRVYSMTKPITGMASMLLVENGKIGLDQPLYDIFPAFSELNVLVDPEKSLDARPAQEPILIRHLLTHSSGFAYGINPPSPLQHAYLDHGIATYQLSVEDEKTEHRPKTLAALADEVAKLPVLFEPGSKWNYSIGLDIMGAVIERVSGVPFDRFLRTRLFDPLGMTNTFFRIPIRKVHLLPANYLIQEGKIVKIDAPPDTIFAREPALHYGGTGLVSSARDYAKFCRMLLNLGAVGRTRIMKPETAKLGMSNLLEPGVFAAAGSGFGAGARVVLKDVPGSRSAGTYTWDGAFDTLFWIDLAKAFYAILMTQIPNSRYPLEREFAEAIYKDRA